MLLNTNTLDGTHPFVQKLIDSTPGILCTLNENGLIEFANQEFHTLLGYTTHHLKGKSFTSIVSHSDYNKVASLLDRVRSGPDTVSSYFECITIDMQVTVLFWTIRWGPEEKIFYCIGHSGLERTDLLQNRYEKKVKEQNQTLSDILERIQDGFIAVDEDDRVIYWNRQAELISGRSRDEVLTQNIFDCYPEILKSPLYLCHQKAKKHQTPQQYDAYYPQTERWIEVTIYPSNKGLTGFFRDITEKKFAEETRELQKKQSQKRNTAAVIKAQEKERAQVGLILHDNVNQVLTTVKLYTELLMNDVGEKELLNKCKTLLQNCIDEIRALSKQLSAPTLGDIVMKDSILELTETMSSTGNTSISLVTNNLEKIVVAPEMHLAIYRLLQEHLTNIIQHADAGEVRVVIDYTCHELVVKVTDDGKGFDMRSMKEGVGISSMISLVESLGGRLSINSAPGLGCVLIAEFMLQEDK